MARGRWEDFADKHGFNDGDSVDTLDFAARDFLIKLLNQNSVMRTKKLRAIAYNFAGVHNGARILIVKGAESIHRMPFRGTLPKRAEIVELPAELRDQVDDLVDTSYDQAWDALARQFKRALPRRSRAGQGR